MVGDPGVHPARPLRGDEGGAEGVSLQLRRSAKICWEFRTATTASSGRVKGLGVGRLGPGALPPPSPFPCVLKLEAARPFFVRPSPWVSTDGPHHNYGSESNPPPAKHQAASTWVGLTLGPLKTT